MSQPADHGATPYVPDDAAMDDLRAAVGHCRGCDLYQAATQAVFGEGDPDAKVVLIGEQPGDREDREGHPFVGPAGRLLDRALADAGIERDQTYRTNVVKHFRYSRTERTGKRRIHQPPTRTQIVACRPWLEAELALLAPDVIVCLGATAAKAIMGPRFRVSRERGDVHQSPLPEQPPVRRADQPLPQPRLVATVHPSSALRAPDRDDVYAGLVADLRVVAGETSA